MERDPVRFVWRHALPLNLAVLVLALLVVPGVWLTGELVRLLVDEALAGRGFAGPGATVPFGRLALALPERIADEPIVLASGVRLGRAAFAQATLAGLALAALVSGLFVLAAGRLAAATGAPLLAALDRLLAGRAGTNDDRREALAQKFVAQTLGAAALAAELQA